VSHNLSNVPYGKDIQSRGAHIRRLSARKFNTAGQGYTIPVVKIIHRCRARIMNCNDYSTARIKDAQYFTLRMSSNTWQRKFNGYPHCCLLVQIFDVEWRVYMTLHRKNYMLPKDKNCASQRLYDTARIA
jgi:hypothetical protein